MARELLLRQLEYLVALAREEHFGRAARACHASQPALSTGLRKLESELGVTLVHHGRRYTGLTAEGRRVLGWAHRILAERDGLHDDLERMRGGLAVTLRLGAIPTAMPVVGRLVRRFCDAHPRARACVEELPSTRIVQRLADFSLDAGLTYLDPEPPHGTRAIELYRERYELLGPEHLADADEPIDWTRATAAPVCALSRVMRNRRILESAALAAGSRLEVAVEADSVAGLFALAAQGWPTIVSHIWLDAFGLPPSTRSFPLPPVVAPPVGVLVSAEEPLSMAASALLGSLPVPTPGSLAQSRSRVGSRV